MLSQSTSGPSRDTDRVVALFQQAVALHENDQLEDAEQLYRAVLRQDRRNMQALYNLCLIHYTRNHLVEALQVARRGLYQAPNWLEMLNLMALILKGLGKYPDAIERFRRALAINPNISLVHFNLAQLFQDINLHEDALAHFRQASAIEPEAAVAHCNVGVALRTLGRIEEANVALEHAVALEPREPTYYRMLSYSWRFTTGDRYLVAMQSMAEDLASLNEQQQIDLHFALGKAYEDIGQHETGFRHFLAGNALKRQETPYDEPTVLNLVEQSRLVFTPEVMRERSGFGHPSPAPIFIVGMPRSGSTLIEQILASHPDVFGAGELRDFVSAVEGLDRGPNNTPEEVGGNDLRQLGERYMTLLRSRVPVPAERITDKMLGNSRLVGLIHLALPNARIIHARRNPLDNCLSCFSTLFAAGHHYSYELGELGRYWCAQDALMRYWRTVLPDGVMLTVDYEALVDDLETHARRIIAHCGLEWTDACLDFHKTERAVYTASVVQVRQPIYRSSVGRWKPYQALLQPLFDGLAIAP